MSEEEIIKIITYKLNMKDTDVYAPILYDEIQALLDLYQKEKEKNKEYEKLHLTEYKLAPDGHLWCKTIELDDYISKDKIKEIINKLKNNDVEYSEHIAMLEELLEERN